MERILFFDTGPVISLTMNNLLWLLEPLKKSFGGDFYITTAVRRELIDQPLTTRKYKFEALQVLPYLNKGTLKVVKNTSLEQKTLRLLTLINNTFSAKGNWITLVQFAEIETLAAALDAGSEYVVIDERTTRYIIENPMAVRERMQKKLHTRVDYHKENVQQIRELFSGLKVIRSAELVTRAYELGFLNKYIEDDTLIDKPKRAVLEAVLWGVKLNGCAVSEEEIEQILRIEKV